MKLRELQIHNFRGILDQVIDVKDYTLLVGPNNSGKSTVIDAIRAFYGKYGFSFNHDFPFKGAQDEESWIELKFELSDEEYESLPDTYKTASRRLRVRKYLYAPDKKCADRKTAVEGRIFAYNPDDELLYEPFTGMLGDIIYIPAMSKIDDYAKRDLSGRSELRDLLTSILRGVVANSTAYSTFSQAVETFAKTIRQETTSDGKSLEQFEHELNSYLTSWNASFKLDFPTPDADTIVRTMMEWKLEDKTYGQDQKIELFGSGFQRQFIYLLIRLGSRYIDKTDQKRKVQKRKSPEFSPSLTLILFEEPEAFLHPPQQEELARSLMEWAQTESCQVICATHSVHFVSKNAADLPAIVRLRRQNGEVKVFQITEKEWQSIVRKNQEINEIMEKYNERVHEDDRDADMEAIKYFLWIDPGRAAAFFANHVLLVEGPTEVALINKLISDGRINKRPHGLFVMDCMGKYNIHRFMHLLSYMGVTHSVLFDDDHDEGIHLGLNRLIENSASEFTVKVQRVEGNLEEFLGLGSAGSKRRKPQHCLYQYEQGRIDDAKLDKFCKLVESCLPDPSWGAGGVEVGGLKD